MSRWRGLFVLCANTAFLVLIVEGGAYLAVAAYDRVVPPMSYRHLSEPVRRNYAHMTPAAVDELLRATRSLRYRYAHGPGFVPAPLTSTFLNVDASGVRSNGPVRRDLADAPGAIWFLGGSTAFGAGVADHETIPAQLERLVNRPVINLAVPAQFSAAENRLFTHHLRIGHRPAAAVFLDGINETCETAMFSEDIEVLLARPHDGRWPSQSPALYAYHRVAGLLTRMLVSDATGLVPLTCADVRPHEPLRAIHGRVMAERDAFCRLYGVRCLTFVQPFPGVHGRHDDLDPLELADLRVLFGHLEASWRASGAIFITHALDGDDRHAFVDAAHYSARANGLIAAAIAPHVP